MKRTFSFLVIVLNLFFISGCKSIFHIEFGKHVNLNNNEVINNGLNVENMPIEQSPTELDIVSDKYRAIWREDYKYDTPILINDLEDFKSFLSDHPVQSANDDILQKSYNDEFFKQNVMYAFVKSEGSDPVEFTVKKAEIGG